MRGESTPGGEEGLEKSGGFGGEDAGCDFDLMVEPRIGEDFEAGAKCAPFGVVGAINDAGNAGLDDGAGAHGARFEGDVEGGAVEAVIFDGLRHFADDDDFRVGGGVVVPDGAVAGADQNGAAMNHDRADGDLASFGGGLRFGESELHEVDVVFGHAM